MITIFAEMSHVYFSKNIASFHQNHVIYIVQPEIDLYVSHSSFLNCYSIECGSAVYFTSGEAILQYICGYNCSSLDDKEPAGAMIHISHSENQTNDVKLIMCSHSRTPSSLSTYSAITLNYGMIKYNNVNASMNIATANPALYIGASSGENSVSTGSFIHVIDCYAINEIIFNRMGIHNVQYINMINCTTKNLSNGNFRLYKGESTITHGNFLNNHGTLFISFLPSSILRLQQCYYPTNANTTGYGLVEGTPIEQLIPYSFPLHRCEADDLCSLVQKHASKFSTFLSLYLFLTQRDSFR